MSLRDLKPKGQGHSQNQKTMPQDAIKLPDSTYNSGV